MYLYLLIFTHPDALPHSHRADIKNDLDFKMSDLKMEKQF